MKQISQFTMLNLMNVHLKWLDKHIATTWVSSASSSSFASKSSFSQEKATIFTRLGSTGFGNRSSIYCRF